MIQNIFNQIPARIASLMRQKLTRNIGWLTGAEMVSRVGRIIAAIVLARQLDAVAFGIAAIALTVFELVRVFTENGIGAAVIRARADEFDRVANTAHRLMWAVSLALAAIQLIAGLAVEAFLPGRQAGLMVASLSIVFLVMPFGLLHAYCLQRSQRMKCLAAVSSAQAVTDHVLTALLALTGFGAWAIVLPKVLTTPIWLLGVRYEKPWTRRPQAGRTSARSILTFALPVLGAELLSAFRDHLDKLVISLVLGIEALGIYYFAFNAGLGVSTALNRAFSNAVYPHLCATADKVGAFRRAILGLGLPLSLAYFVQAGAALIYVPIVFGPAWAHVAPLVALLCLGGPARLLVDGARMEARAAGRSGQEFLFSLGFSLSILVPLALTAHEGLYHAAAMSVFGASFYSLAATLRVVNPARPSTDVNAGAAS